MPEIAEAYVRGRLERHENIFGFGHAVYMTYDPRARCYVEDPAYGVGYLGPALAHLSATLGRRWHFRAMDGRAGQIRAVEELAHRGHEPEAVGRL